MMMPSATQIFKKGVSAGTKNKAPNKTARTAMLNRTKRSTTIILPDGDSGDFITRASKRGWSLSMSVEQIVADAWLSQGSLFWLRPITRREVNMPKVRCGLRELDGDLVLFGCFLADPNHSAMPFFPTHYVLDDDQLPRLYFIAR